VRLGAHAGFGHEERRPAGRGLEYLDRGHARTGRDEPGLPIPRIDEVHDLDARSQVLSSDAVGRRSDGIAVVWSGGAWNP
jgi:hypothetical protein